MEEEHANADGKMHSQCAFEVYETQLPQAFVRGPFEKVTTFLSTSHSLVILAPSSTHVQRHTKQHCIYSQDLRCI